MCPARGGSRTRRRTRPKSGAGGEEGREDAARGTAAEHHRGDERLQREEREEKPDAADTEERFVRHVLTVAEELRIPNPDDAEDREGERHHPKDVHALGAKVRRPSDEAHVEDREQPDDDTGQ